MASIRALRPARRLTAALALVALAPILSGCGLLGDDEPPPTVSETRLTSHGPCIPTYGNRVIAADMNGSGSRVLYLTSSKPRTLPEEQGWSSDDRALVVMDLGESGARSRHIAISWSATASIEPYATARPNERPQEIELPEQMLDVEMDDAGSSFVVAVKRRGSTGVYSGLYHGAIPADGTADLNPDQDGGLSAVEITHASGVEAIHDFWLSPDGEKVAAIVGPVSELRIYDLAADTDNLTVFDRGEEGEVVVGHSMPEAATSVAVGREPAITARGLLRLAWSPDSERLAIVRTQNEQAVSRSTLEILDPSTGEMTLVRSYDESAAPHVAWSADGSSFWVLNTPLGSNGDSIFAAAQIRHIQAAEGGEEIGSGASLPRQLGWRADPGNLVRFVDGESLVYTWEGRIYRLDLTGGDLAGAQSAYLLLRSEVPQDLRVLPDEPVASAESNRIMFRIQDASGTRIAIRDYATDDACPIEEQAPADEAPAEEGEAASDEG